MGGSAVESAFCDTQGVSLIETLGWDGTAYSRLDLHLDRLCKSALLLGFACDREAARQALDAAVLKTPARVRLTLDAQGAVAVTVADLPPARHLWRLALAPERLASNDPWLGVKSTRRLSYDAARATLPVGLEELLFLNERDEVCDGTITTLFFDLGLGMATPPLRCGLLPGVLRAQLLATGACHEAILQASDLPNARLWVGNSLRGLIPALWVGENGAGA
jgi:4-amino-4-deoxychorismate lyase